jgi:ligand-binding sensor domain-containing protein/signal transduction histidine kinase
MRNGEITQKIAIAVALGSAIFAARDPVTLAQQLPLRHYDLRDGLVNSRVIAIHQDAKGYLWFGTWEGLSRFDGYRFTNYGINDGLGNAVVNAITEDRQGRLWVATNGGGVSRLIDDPRDAIAAGVAGPVSRKFESFQVGESPESNRVNAMLFDSNDNCWCATDDGLYKSSPLAAPPIFDLVVSHSPAADFMAAFADSRDRLWFGIKDQLIEVAGGEIIKYSNGDEAAYPVISSIAEDRQHRLLVANNHGLFEFVEPSVPHMRGRFKRSSIALEPGLFVHQMTLDTGGALWIGTNKGLIKFTDTRKLFTSTHGLSDDHVSALFEDRDNNLWIGTWTGGVCKLSGEMIVSFSRAEGLPDQNVARIIEDKRGHIYASTLQQGLLEIAAAKATIIQGSEAMPFTNVGTRVLTDRNGDWWLGTDHGLFWFQGPELQLKRGKRFAATAGISDDVIHEIHQDPSGGLWISAGDRNLYYSDPGQSGRTLFKRVSLEAVRPASSVSWMASDHSGSIWIGGRFGLLARLKGATALVIEPTASLPEIEPRTLFVDSRGWLWVGLRNSGASVSKDPGAQRPEFVNYSTSNGLASDYVGSITEDDKGRMYLGTFKGLDRLDPLTGEIRHFTTKDGLAGDIIGQCMKDTRGNIWVATSTGISKLDPSAENVAAHQPAIFLSRVQIAGEDFRLAETGTTSISGLVLPAARNDLLVEYIGLSFQGEQEIKYQYKLEGTSGEWSAPSDLRFVNYGRLAPGQYRFMVRSISQQGITSAEPAVLEFRILQPLWLRWWFITLMTLLVAVAMYALVRYRLQRLIELERVRTRIASDLHDDIGSNLSLIAGLSEVLGQQARSVDSRMADRLSQIAAVSRRSVDAMSDIVWAVNPKHDRLIDLSQRMRRFASDSFTARDIQLRFKAPDKQHDIKIGAEIRREVFLIFKEAVHNAVRHSGCKSAEVALEINRRMIVLRVSDDGTGFDQKSVVDGHGLTNMKERAEKISGELAVNSRAGAGSEIILKAPVLRRLPRTSL